MGSNSQGWIFRSKGNDGLKSTVEEVTFCVSLSEILAVAYYPSPRDLSLHTLVWHEQRSAELLR